MNKKELENNFEREVVFSNEEISDRAKTRYKRAKDNLIWKRVLEIWCSSWFWTRILPKDIDYTWIDYDEKIIEVAKKEYWDKNHKFIFADINKINLSRYDTIIAFELIEHLENWKEIAQELKKHCKRLLLSTPYNETPWLWGIHHKLHWLTEKDFDWFIYNYIWFDWNIIKKPELFDGRNLMLMKRGETILANIPTYWRYDTTLPLTLISVINQTKRPDKLIIYDNNDTKKDLREIPMYNHIFQLLDRKNIEWEVQFCDNNWQHFNHQSANKSWFTYVWRLDDDIVCEPNVLELLYNEMQDWVWAVWSSVMQPDVILPINQKWNNKIDDIKWLNAQWYEIEETKEVEHLHCSFLYRAWIVDYNLALSRIAHTEETQFSYRFFQEWYKVLITKWQTRHLKNPYWWVRTWKEEMFDHDEQIFLWLMKYWKIFVLNNWLWDHIVFKKLLPLIKQKYSKYTIACCYPDVFEWESVISIWEAESLLWNLDNFNIYKRMIDNNWNKELYLAYKEMLWL